MHAPDPHAAVRGLLDGRVRTIEEVDVLLLLRSMDRSCNVPELARGTQLHAEQVGTALMSLLAHGLVLVRADGYLYAPSNVTVDRAIDALARLNLFDRAGLLALLADSAITRVRSNASELLAEVFGNYRSSR
jgi:hypothetical protein